MIRLIECPKCGELTSINTENKLTKEQLITVNYGYCFSCQDFISENKVKEEDICQDEEKMK